MNSEAGSRLKIAVGTKQFSTIAGHAGRTRDWLLFEAENGIATANPPQAIVLEKAQLIHYYSAHGEGPHPLDGTRVVITGSAGEGFIRHMESRGARVILTGETDPGEAVRKVLAGEALAETRFDVTTMLCKVHDLFSRH